MSAAFSPAEIYWSSIGSKYKTGIWTKFKQQNDIKQAVT